MVCALGQRNPRRRSNRDFLWVYRSTYLANFGSFSWKLNHHPGASRHPSWPGGAIRRTIQLWVIESHRPRLQGTRKQRILQAAFRNTLCKSEHVLVRPYETLQRPIDMATKHLPLHTMWSHIFESTELGDDDASHLASCKVCQKAFLVCLKSESLRASLKTLVEESETSSD